MELQLMMAAPSEEIAQETMQEVLPRDEQQVLSVEQSLQLVKIFLNSSIACVCYTRELLRWTSECLRTRYIEQVSLKCDDPEQIYGNFLHARGGSPTSSQQVRVLVRSNDKRANSILDMLENGVFDALKSTYLDTLQVFVATNAAGARSILETYTYQFEYEKDRIASVRLQEAENSFTLLRSQKSFKAAIRGLLRAMQELPRLPGKHDKCVLGMSMAYNNNCPHAYEPPGFTHASKHTIASNDWDMLWQTPSAFAASFESTYHHVKIAAKGPWLFDPTTSQLQDTVISKELQSMQKTSSSRNQAFHSTLPPDRSPENKRKDVNGEESMDRQSKRRREAKDSLATGIDEPTSLRLGTKVEDQAEQETETAAVDKSCPVQSLGSIAKRRERATPRRRKKSISKTFVTVGGSTPASQRYLHETASEDDSGRMDRSTRASSTATSIRFPQRYCREAQD